MEEAAQIRGAIPAPEPANPEPLDGAQLREAFERARPYTVGIEDEVMLLDPETLELAPVAQELLQRVGDDARFKLELPASTSCADLMTAMNGKVVAKGVYIGIFGQK